MNRLLVVCLENVKTGRLGRRTHGFRTGEGAKTTVCGLTIFLTNPEVQFSVVGPSETHEINCPHCKEELLTP